MQLRQQISISSYLSDSLKNNADLNDYANGIKQVDTALLRTCIQALIDQKDAHSKSQEQRSKTLRLSKHRFALLWSIADLSQSIDFVALSELQSHFADISIQLALDIAWRSPKIAKLFANNNEVQAEHSGIFILALGKLGGNDLNFSSDIDLIAFYDKQLLEIAPMQGASYVVTQCLQSMSSILSEPTKDGFVWRVDWRLRPYASLRNLSMTAEKALDFYYYSARPWHRLAMLKARPVAGNLKLAEIFLGDLHSFVWRYDLDYRAIDDIAHLKAKINLEHPSLQKQRTDDDVTLDEGQGFNLKLGHGGIREIEFIANALQLLWGGRKPTLRMRNTLKVLRKLSEQDLLENTSAEKLCLAYEFLRRAENHLQMLDNKQSYHLPDQSEKISRFLKIHGYKNWAQFNHVLSQHRENAYEIFKSLFTDQHDNKTTNKQFIWQSVDLKKQHQKTVDCWEDGFVSYGVSHDQSHLFEPLLIALSHEIKQSCCDINDAIADIDDYFRRLPPGGQYFRMLRDYPWLLQKIISPLLLSKTMAILLRQSPHIIDRFLEGEPSSEHQLDTTIVFSNTDYEYRLKNLRRLTNEELYLRYSLYFEGKISPLIFQASLTTLAERILDAALKIACDEMGLERVPIAIIGFGKLGAVGMMPNSDLDLVYLCNSLSEHALASQFSARLNTIINTPMREGRVYELDTRLRPSGQSGSVTISLESYARHQRTRAHSWSHLALIPARFVAGDKKIGAQFSNIKANILAQPRDINQFKHDAAKMLMRVKNQKGLQAKADQFSAKLRPGGLFELEYLQNCIAVLKAIDDNLLDKNERDRKLALQNLTTLQLEIRLFGHDTLTFEALPKPVLSHVLSVLNCRDIKALIEVVNTSTTVTQQHITQFFNEIDWDALSDWQETPVNWL